MNLYGNRFGSIHFYNPTTPGETNHVQTGLWLSVQYVHDSWGDWWVLHRHLAWTWASWWVWRQTNTASWRDLVFDEVISTHQELNISCCMAVKATVAMGLSGWAGSCWCHFIHRGQRRVSQSEVNECVRLAPCCVSTVTVHSCKDRGDSERRSWGRSRVPHEGFGSAAVDQQTKKVPAKNTFYSNSSPSHVKMSWAFLSVCYE